MNIAAQGFSWLNVTPHHAETVLRLANHHRDPFDRFLIAQASYEAMRIATYDKVFGLYSPEVFIVKNERRLLALTALDSKPFYRSTPPDF